LKAAIQALLAVALGLAGCATQNPGVPATATPSGLVPPPPSMSVPQAPSAAVPAQPTVQQELDRAAQKDLEEAIALYDKGDFNGTVDRIASSAAIGRGSIAIQTSAYKLSAFSYCVTRRAAQCRAQFEAAFKADPAFDLAPAERGHPLWGPVFDRVRRAQATSPKR